MNDVIGGKMSPSQAASARAQSIAPTCWISAVFGVSIRVPSTVATASTA